MLYSNPTLRYTLGDISFFKHYYDALDEPNKAQIKHLIENG